MIKLYYYSTMKKTELVTPAEQGIGSKAAIENAGKLSQLVGGVNYLKEFHLFMDPVPRNITELLGPKFERWQKGSVIYEHVIEVSTNSLFWVLNTPEVLAYDKAYYNPDIFESEVNETKWYLDRKEALSHLKIKGSTLSELQEAIDRYRGDIKEQFKALGEATDIASEYVSYGPRITQIGLSPRLGRLTPIKINEITL